MPLSYKVLSKDDKDDEDDDDEMELERDGAAYASRALARPASGEVKWWIMGVVEKGKGKEDDYGWSEVGGKCCCMQPAHIRRGHECRDRAGEAYPRSSVVAIGAEPAGRVSARGDEQHLPGVDLRSW